MNPRPLHVLVTGLLLASCGGPKNLHLALGPPLAEPLPGIALAEPVILAATLRVDPWEAFHQGYFVGNIWFSGGYELMPEEDNQVRSVNVDFSEEAPYAQQAVGAVGDGFANTLTKHGLAWQPVQESVERAVQPPRRTDVRGTGPFDGSDNQNLPRYDLTPMPLEVAGLPTLPPGTQAVLVPLLVHYYSHNGGWFVGQNNGCPAGARLRVLWSLHDTDDGRVLSWGEVGVQHEEEYHYSPNNQELQDYLLTVEAALFEHLDDQLPR